MAYLKTNDQLDVTGCEQTSNHRLDKGRCEQV